MNNLRGQWFRTAGPDQTSGWPPSPGGRDRLGGWGNRPPVIPRGWWYLGFDRCAKESACNVSSSWLSFVRDARRAAGMIRGAVNASSLTCFNARPALVPSLRRCEPQRLDRYAERMAKKCQMASGLARVRPRAIGSAGSTPRSSTPSNCKHSPGRRTRNTSSGRGTGRVCLPIRRGLPVLSERVDLFLIRAYIPPL